MTLAAINNGISSLFRRRRLDPKGDLKAADDQRIRQYGEYLRAYQGFAYRGPLSTSVAESAKRITFNFCRPIIHIAAGWLAGGALVWEVGAKDGSTNEEATAAAKAIWDRSGAERTFLDAALMAGIYGDAVVMAAQSVEGPVLKFLDPSICFPTFDGADHSRMVMLEIAYQVTAGVEEAYIRREMYEETYAAFYNGDEQVGFIEYDELPAVWVRNNCVQGLPFGLSDLDGITELVDTYDHLAKKQRDIADYYAQPRIVIEGARPGNLTLDIDTVIYTGSQGGKAYFLERQGDAPDIEAALTRIRNAIAEVSQVPAVAFGQMDKGYTTISGIGMKILYGPLLDKTRRKQAAWGPALERAMWMALKAVGQEVAIADVNLIWPDPVPVDPLQEVQREAQATTAGLKSRQTAMRAIGVEDPEGELLRIKEERAIFTPGLPSRTTTKSSGRDRALEGAQEPEEEGDDE